jgi:putative transposase
MSEFRKTSANDLYFVTLTIVGWVNLFDREIYKQIIVDNLSYCQEKEHLEIFSYVIMSNQIHLICRRIDNYLNELLGRFKSYTSKQFIKEIKDNPRESRKEWLLKNFEDNAKRNKQYSNFHIWQYTSHPVYLYSIDFIKQKINYIHQNPVRAGYVNEAEHYKYSSANIESPLKSLEI